MKTRKLLLLLLLLLLLPVLALWAGAVCAAGIDPLVADINARDAWRFAELMKDGAVPTSCSTATYRYAIRECLPQLPALRGDLRAIYLAFAGLLPERPLPAIDVVFGALDSGGTAGNGKRAAIRELLRLRDPAAILKASGYGP